MSRIPYAEAGKGVRATSFLHISKQLAWYRPPSTTCRHCDSTNVFLVRAPQGTATVPRDLSAPHWDRRRSASSPWLMDARLWSVDRSRRDMGCVFQCQSRYSHHAGNVGCHTGDDRTWCVVHRCASIRPEAFRDSRTLATFSPPPEREAPCSHNVVSLAN